MGVPGSSGAFSALRERGLVAELAGFLTVFFAMLLLAGFIARIASSIVRHAGLNWVDRLPGRTFGLAPRAE
jgi:uncharacterized membrane protein required for colicin V production